MQGARPAGDEHSRVLIVGASQAGVQLASSLRELGHLGAITLVGDESHPPYARPPLSKTFLVEDLRQESLEFRTPDFYASNDIIVVTEERVTSISTHADGSGQAVAASGTEFSFDRLALAVGAQPRRLTIAGSDLRGIYYLRSASDAMALKAGLLEARRIVVVGGGFIGLEVAASARLLGCEVTVVLADHRVLSRSVGEYTSGFYEAAHASRGVEVLTGVAPAEFHGGQDGRVSGVALSDGTSLVTDMVVVGIGVEPSVELATDMGLRVSNGIVIDEFALASDGRTVAAGDCVNCPNPFPELFGNERIRFESVNAATETARVAAATIAGQRLPFRAVPWFWSNQYDLKLQVAGLSSNSDHFVIRGDIGAEKFAILYYRHDRLIAADCVNRPVDFAAVRGALASRKTIDPVPASDVDIPLKKLARDVEAGADLAAPGSHPW